LPDAESHGLPAVIRTASRKKSARCKKQKSSLANDVLGEEKFSQSLSLDDLRYFGGLMNAVALCAKSPPHLSPRNAKIVWGQQWI